MNVTQRAPGPPPAEMIRQIPYIQTHPVDYLSACAKKYGDFVQFPVGNLPVYFVNDPDAIQQVLQLNHRNYTKDTLQYRSLAAITGNGLLTSDGEYWFGQRRRIQPAFVRPNVARLAEQMAETVQEHAAQLQARLQPGAPVDVDEIMLELALEIVGRSLFSVDLSAEAGRLVRAVVVALDHIIARARTPVPLPLSIPTPANLRFKRALAEIDRAARAIIAQRREQADPPQDLLSMLLASVDAQSGQKMDDEQLRDELVTILIAGHETVASALTWTWYLLAKHPEVRARLQQEIDTRLAGRPARFEDLDELPFTRQVFEEALRLYPPAWLITRRSIAADTLCGYPIPAGALIIISPFTIQRHPQYWDHPEVFDPDRFAPGPTDRKKYSYIPFGGGPRLCIGNHFAMVEAQLVVATFAQRLVFDLPEPSLNVPALPLVTLRPHGGMRMQARVRP